MYFNEAAPHVEFQLMEDIISLATLTSKLNEFLSDTNNRKVSKIKFREDQVDSNGNVKCNRIELKTDEDVTVLQRSFRRWLTKGPIELDAKISRFVDDIIKMMKHP